MSDTITDAMGRCLNIISQGKAAQLGGANLLLLHLGGLAVERGLARTVRHRDHTRTLALTSAGLEQLSAWNARKEGK